MGKVDWKQVETIVDQVLELPEKEWFEYVDKKCNAPQEVKSEVTRLLQSISDSEGWLENAGTYRKDLLDSITDASTASSLVGAEIGSYRITGIVAEGGMGVVYRGERTDGEFEHTVALKVIKVGMSTDENIRLFNRERNILAGLSHPGIARLFDGGVLEDGSPYLVMEFIEGTPIDRYCDENRLTIDQRINLFKKVLLAVRHAHENLIIHRDLKPDNILITNDGQVKILDFGIAKLLDTEKKSGQTDITQTRMLTPKYAAPEQIRQQPVTTATDLYSLGIILYQLLVGHHPYEIEGKSAYETEQAVLNNDPVVPDRRLADSNLAEKISAERSSGYRNVLKVLKGDMNAILLKAIEKDPANRYRTSSDLLDEFERYGAGHPVSARQRTVGYRLNKFIRRNTAPLAVVSTFLLLVISFTIYHTSQITLERNQAQLEAEKAERVTEFLVSLFSRSNPYLEESDGGTDVTVGSILDFGTEKIDEELADQPEIRAELKTVLGEVYDALSEFNKAEALLSEAVKIRRNSGVASNTQIANSIRNLAFLYQEQGKFDESEVLLEEAISYYELSEEGIENHDAISTIARLGNLNWYNKGNYDAADSLLNKALELRRIVHDSAHVHIAINYNDLATLYHAKGDYETAEPYYRQSIEIYRRLSGEHSNLAIIMANFSALLKEQGNYEEAENFQRKSLAMHRKLTGDDNMDIALGAGNLGDIMLEQNALDEADSLLHYSMEIFEGIYDSSHTYLSRTKLNLGRLNIYRSNFSQAERILLETKEEYEQLFPQNHPRLSDPLVELGNLFLVQNLPEKAEPYLRDALDIRQSGYGEKNWRTAQAMSYLGIGLYQLDRLEEAEPYLIRSYETLNEKRDEKDKYRRQTLEYIIRMYENMGKNDLKEQYQNEL